MSKRHSVLHLFVTTMKYPLAVWILTSISAVCCLKGEGALIHLDNKLLSPETKLCSVKDLHLIKSRILEIVTKELNLELTVRELTNELFFRYNTDDNDMIDRNELTSLWADYIIYPSIKHLAKTCGVDRWLEADDKDDNRLLTREEFGNSFDVKPKSLFFVLGNDGVHLIDPATSSLLHHIRHDDVIGSSTSPICTAGQGRQCNWGGAVNVGNKYIYAADFLGSRVVVFDVSLLRAVREIATDEYPFQLTHLKSVDEVWVLCGNNNTLDWLTEDDDISGSLFFISDVSTRPTQTSIKARQILGTSSSRSVHSFYEPTNCAVDEETKYGYIIYAQEPRLHQIDLVTKNFSHIFALRTSQCHGIADVVFSQPYSYAFVQCYTDAELSQITQLLLNLKDGTVLSENAANFGRPFVSPDGQYVLTLNDFTIMSQYIDPVGNIHMLQPIKTNLRLSDLAFYPRVYGYDVYVTSEDKSAVIILRLDTNVQTIKLIPDVGKPSRAWDREYIRRPIISACRDARYLATPSTSDDSVIIIDGEQQDVHGKVKSIGGARTIVWVSGGQ